MKRVINRTKKSSLPHEEIQKASFIKPSYDPQAEIQRKEKDLGSLQYDAKTQMFHYGPSFSSMLETPVASRENQSEQEINPLEDKEFVQLNPEPPSITFSQAGVFANNKYIWISIEGDMLIDCKTIDNRIKHNGVWQQDYPVTATIGIPAQYAEEILIKLKQHPDITSVDGELTRRGIEVQNEFRL